MSTLEIAGGLGSIITMAIGYLSVFLVKLWKTKIKSILAQKAAIFITDLAMAAVKKVNQSYMDDLKAARKDGVITDEEKANANANAWKIFKEAISPAQWAKMALDMEMDEGNLTKYVDAKIEAAVSDAKTPAVNPTQ